MASQYEGLSVALATMHGKEQVIAPMMRKHLGVDVITPSEFDTDSFGSFTGEIPRIGTMRDVAIRKARAGMQATGLKVGIASEGSFGPHPTIPFIRVGMELMVLVDDQRGIVVSESLIADETNHEEIVVEGYHELEEFLVRVSFPTHALVVGPNLTQSPWWSLHPDLKRMQKGITDRDELKDAVARAAARSEDGRARAMSDLRAHVNPTRMKSISALSEKLARRIVSTCPKCGTPGFGAVAPSPGLPCRECDEETIIPRGDIMGCVACKHRREVRRVLPALIADPADCPRCNP